jgi:hypothetical protein
MPQRFKRKALQDPEAASDAHLPGRMKAIPQHVRVFSYRTVPSALELPQIMPPAVAYGLYRRSGIGKAFFVFPHPVPKTFHLLVTLPIP